MGKFLGDIWNGKTFSLAKHYWLFLVLPGVVFSILEKIIEFRSLSFPPFQYGLVSGILWTIAVTVFVVGYVGLINCARFRGFRGWSAVAVTVTTLSLIGAIAKAVTEFSGNPVSETQQLYDSAAAINAQLPKKIDAITALTQVEYSNNVFTYYYDIDPAAYQSPNWSVYRMKDAVKRKACETSKDSLGTSALLNIRYVYKTGGRDNIVIEVGEKDCELSRYGQIVSHYFTLKSRASSCFEIQERKARAPIAAGDTQLRVTRSHNISQGATPNLRL